MRREVCAAFAIVTLFSPLIINGLCFSNNAGGIGLPRLLSHKRSKHMGVHQYLYLFDTNTYKEKVLPAYKEFSASRSAKPIANLVDDCVQKLRGSDIKKVRSAFLGGDKFVDRLRDIESGKLYEMDTDSVFSEVTLTLCVPEDRNVDPLFPIGHSPLLLDLVESNENLDGFLYGNRGEILEVHIGGESPNKFFTREDLTEFNDEVGKTPLPDANERSERDLEHLKKLLKVCMENPNLTLLLVIL